MPIFEYVCKKCGTRFEKLQKGSASEECSCPSCGSLEVKKALSVFSSAGGSESKCNSGG